LAEDRFTRFPESLAKRARTERFGQVPVLLAHPDWERPSPTILWLHGRTVSKELDPGRYLRWIRSGIAACAIDLPFHGERLDEAKQGPRHTLEMITRGVAEIDGIVRALAGDRFEGVFDTGRLGIGGMSAGGMITLRRLCDEHAFRCAAVEATCGSLMDLYHPDGGIASDDAPGVGRPYPHPPESITPADPMQHLDDWRPIPFLAVHSESDRMVPWRAQEAFLRALRAQYEAVGADPGMIEVVTWPETGAPHEHLGFGRYANESKKTQVSFLMRHLQADTQRD